MKASAEERFWAKVEKTQTCWLWTATRNPDGYGMFSAARRTVSAHRWAYEVLVGPIPEGLVVDHLCRVRHCVNPAHMEIVTNVENIRRGRVGEAAREAAARITHCPQQHPYDEENTGYRINKLGHRCRYCLTCNRERVARYKLEMASQ